MKKEIKDYLHLYLGCQVKCPKLSGWIYSQKIILLSEYFWLSNYEKELIPILRPLSDITDNELDECVKLQFGIDNKDIVGAFKTKTVRRNEVKSISKYGTSIPYSMFKENGDHYMTATLSFSALSPDQFFYLLSKHFDLFGLIESGLAIDKTKIKNNE